MQPAALLLLENEEDEGTMKDAGLQTWFQVALHENLDEVRPAPLKN